MGYLGKRPATQGKDAGPALRLDDVSSNFDGLTTVFNLTVNGTAVAPHVNNIQVYLSGVHQLPGSSYTLSGSQIVFSGAPSSSLGFHGNVIGDSRLFIPDNDTVEPASFTANTISTISGSFISGFNYSGTISGSSTSTASFGRLEVAGNTNLTGDIEFDDVTATGNITSTGTNKVISGSITSTGSFGRLQIDSTASFGRVITSTADINGGTIDGITSLTSGGDLDIGAHDLRASTLTADSLTATRVPFAGTAGVLSDDSDLTFATATLSATNLTTTGTIKDFTSVSGSSVSTGSFGRVITSTADINGGTVDGITSLTAGGDLDIGAHDLRAETLTADSLTATRVPFAGTAGVLSDDSDLTFATATLSATNLTTTGTIKDFGLVSGSFVSTGSVGRVQTRTADIGIITGTSLTTSGNISGSTTSTGSFGRLQTQQDNASIGGNILTLAGNLTTTTGPGTIDFAADKTLTLNESLTVGDGHDGTLTFSAASKTLTVENTSVVNQDLTSDASPTFAGATITGTLTVQEIHTEFESASILFTSGSTQFGNSTDDVHNVTGSMKITGSFQVDNGTLTAGTVDINGGTIDGITSLTAGGDLDIGAHNLRAATITADGLTATRVPFAGTAGLLSDDSDLTFATATLSATNLTTTGTIKNMALVSGSSVSTGSFGRVQVLTADIGLTTGTTGSFGRAEITAADINGGTIDGITSLTAGGDLDIGAHDFRAATITADGLTATRVPFAGTAGVLSDDADLTFATATLSATNLTTTGTIKNMALVSGSFVSTGSVGRIQTRAADIGTITGTTLTTTGNITMADDTSIGIADDAERIEFDGAGDISVLGAKFGIGENAPGSPLDVKSGEAANTANFNSTNGATNITLESDGSLIGQFEFASTGTSQIVTRTVSSLALGVNNSQKLIISGSSGFVGIGEPSPDEMLHLTSTGAVGIKLEADSNNSGQEDAYIILSTDNASIVAELAITSNAGDRITGGLANATILGATTASPVQLFTTDIARLTVAAGGNVGIGTNAPAALLHLNTSDAGSIMRFSRAEGDEALVDNDIVGELEFFANDGSVASNAQTKVGRIFTEISSTALQTNIQFHTFGSSLGERMRINAAGRVGIKEDNPDAFLHVKNAGGATPALKLQDNSSGVNSSYVLMDIDFSNDADIENGKFIIFQDSGGVIGSISGDDDATSFNTSSDYRKKTDLKGIVDATGTINQLKLYDFAWKKNTDKRAVGVIAHEAQEVFPNAVSGEKDAMTTKIYKDENGDKQEKEVMDTQTVDYSKFIPLLLKSIQELTKRIEELEN